MKQILLTAMVLSAAVGIASAQTYAPPTDVLGAHLNYGRGCTACHAPHSGAAGNGITTKDASTGNVALWGEDVSGLVGQVLQFGGTQSGINATGQTPAAISSYAETLPAISAATPDVSGVLMCLSCHDGNYATGAMMQNHIYETVPKTYASQNIPTLLGNDGTGMGNYLNDHPVGLTAAMGCTGPYNWDCTIASGKVQMTGAASSKFVTDYGFFVSPGNWNNTPVVLCTTCHNQHLMNVIKVSASNSGMTPGTYQTMFFLRGIYNPSVVSSTNNTTAQFCRQCHGGESNEMNNGTAGTSY